MYLEFVGLYKTESVVSMGSSLSDDTAIFCNVEAGQIIVATHPSKFYVSFKAESSTSSRFFMNAHFSATLDDNIDFSN